MDFKYGILLVIVIIYKKYYFLEEEAMPRGRKKQENLTLEEQLVAVENQISEMEAQLKDLKNRKKGLTEAIKEAKKEEMYKKVIESGKSIDEILEVLSSKDE